MGKHQVVCENLLLLHTLLLIHGVYSYFNYYLYYI